MGEFKKSYFDFAKEQDIKLESIKKAKLQVLAKSFASYGVGDIVEDSTKRILVNSVFGTLTLGEPCIVYAGTTLTKKNKPKKNGDTGYVFTCENHKGVNLIKKHEEGTGGA